MLQKVQIHCWWSFPWHPPSYVEIYSVQNFDSSHYLLGLLTHVHSLYVLICFTQNTFCTSDLILTRLVEDHHELCYLWALVRCSLLFDRSFRQYLYLYVCGSHVLLDEEKLRVVPQVLAQCYLLAWNVDDGWPSHHSYYGRIHWALQ